MQYLPKIKTLFASIFIGLFVFAAIPSSIHAATAYFSPTQGIVQSQQFKISVYVESSTMEPEMASSQIVITYPESLRVVGVTQGDFDNYTEHSANAATRTITISATNNPGTYKSGPVRIASIDLEAVQAQGPAELLISQSSQITGAGGEQLLTETVNAGYTLNILDGDFADEDTMPTTTPGAGGTTDEIVGEGKGVPATGGNQIAVYLIISTLLVGLGIAAKTNLLTANKN